MRIHRKMSKMKPSRYFKVTNHWISNLLINIDWSFSWFLIWQLMKDSLNTRKWSHCKNFNVYGYMCWSCNLLWDAYTSCNMSNTICMTILFHTYCLTRDRLLLCPACSTLCMGSGYCTTSEDDGCCPTFALNGDCTNSNDCPQINQALNNETFQCVCKDFWTMESNCTSKTRVGIAW